MSTTFYCPEAPRLTGDVPCRMSPCTPEDRCGYCIDGIETLNEPEIPESEFNMGNAAATQVLKTLGIWAPTNGELQGTLCQAEIPGIMQKILVVYNTSTDRELIGRLLRFRTLLSYAHDNDFIVNWG